MSYVFTDSERAQIQAAVSASSGLTLDGDGTYSANAAVGSNAVPLYQTLSDIIGAHISSGAISGAKSGSQSRGQVLQNHINPNKF